MYVIIAFRSGVEKHGYYIGHSDEDDILISYSWDDERSMIFNNYEDAKRRLDRINAKNEKDYNVIYSIVPLDFVTKYETISKEIERLDKRESEILNECGLYTEEYVEIKGFIVFTEHNRGRFYLKTREECEEMGFPVELGEVPIAVMRVATGYEPLYTRNHVRFPINV